MKFRYAIASLPLLVLATACNLPQGPADTENTAPPVSALDDPSHPGIEACATGDVEGQLQIARDFKDSCHEMVVCGGLSAGFTITLVQVLLNAANGNSTEPSGFTYVGQGKYAAGTRMEISLTLGNDMSFGKAGDVIDFDLFNLTNYFTTAKITASTSIDTSGNLKSDVSVEFQGEGHGMELLGLVAGADGKIHTSLDEIASNLGKNVVIEQHIVMLDERDSSTVRYELQSPAVPLGQYINDGPMDMQLLSVNADSSLTGQVVTMNNWGMEYKSTSSSGTLDGSIDFTVKGGAFDYTAKFVYPHRKEPDVTLGCAQ